MSDFGSMVTIHRVDHSSTTEADLLKVKRVVHDLAAAPRDRISEYAEFNLQFAGSMSSNGSRGIAVALTEYWLDDDEGHDGFGSEQLLDRDRPLAEQFAAELQEKLGAEFKVKMICDHW